jgi:putative FmdB family regulatory protein
MPLYEYECGACGYRFERIQRFSDEPIRQCPACSSESVNKLLSAPAIQFKGTGWYVTDYAGKKGGSDTAATPKSDTAAKTDTPAKTDAPAAAAPETPKS